MKYIYPKKLRISKKEIKEVERSVRFLIWFVSGILIGRIIILIILWIRST